MIARNSFTWGLLFVFTVIGAGCNFLGTKQESTLFKKLPASVTGIDFQNKLTFSQNFNIYRYRNFYNGGGVAVGDINNDGLLDLFFTSNMQDNALYINKGGFKFEDISQKAGITGKRAWSTGVSMADVNGDGLLDIYVCNSGIVEEDDQRNELYINNGDSTFTEKAAEYGIDDNALSIHGNFFDYDRDGDLDLYLVNNSYRAIGSFDQEKNTRNVRDPKGGDKLYRNDGGHFTDVSAEAGIYGSEIGFGLGVSVEDVNRDGWPDMYVSNDFFERDYLYLNNQDGTFREVLEEQVNSTSAAAMGGDIADLNGDGYPEIFVTDMLPEKEERLKRVTTFDSWDRYRQYVRDGYFHQFTRNTLQLNNGDGTFSEVGRYAGVEATDWSWGANIADFNLDGRRDIFIANGMLQDITDLDYLQNISREEMVKKIVRDSTVDFKRLIDIIPSNPISNYAFSNNGRMQFADSTKKWGLDRPQFSNGSAYGDLDNDGDPDLIINNLNSTPSVYENRATEQSSGRHWLRLKLQGEGTNTYAIGTQVTAWAEGQRWYAGQFPIRGFQSTSDHRIILGLGETQMLDSLIVDWFNGGATKLTNVKADQELTLKDEASGQNETTDPASEVMAFSFEDITNVIGVNWKHTENVFNDFKRDQLNYHMRSTEGPPVCIADVDGNATEDFYVGGAKGQAGALFLQTAEGLFERKEIPIFQEDAQSEDMACTWLDANGDGSLDLYVASGGNEFPASSSRLADRLYLQNEDSFSRAKMGFSDWRYKTAGTVNAVDYDLDGDQDLFLGARLKPFAVGVSVGGYILQNDGQGNFTDVTDKVAPGLQQIGMLTDSEWGDIDGDGDPDLVVVGEWMSPTVFENEEGVFFNKTEEYGLNQSTGWWKSIELEDLDGDDDLDFVVGNLGLNSRFEASQEMPLELWVNDFDENGTLDPIISMYKNQNRYPVALRHDLQKQLPFIGSKFPTYESYAGQPLDKIIPDSKRKEGERKSITQLASIIGLNEGGTFEIKELPWRAQLSPIYGIHVQDLDADGNKELITGGNLHNVDPEVGRYDASYGSVMRFQEDSLTMLPANKNGFRIEGEIREIKEITVKGIGKVLLVARNDDSIKFFKTTKRADT